MKPGKPSHARAHAAGKDGDVRSACDPAHPSRAITEELALRGMEAFCVSVTPRGRGRGTVSDLLHPVDNSHRYDFKVLQPEHSQVEGVGSAFE